jgi:hypothetical protein
MRLAGRSGDVLEIGVVVQHHRAVVFGHGRGQQVDHAGCAVMSPRGDPDRTSRALSAMTSLIKATGSSSSQMHYSGNVTLSADRKSKVGNCEILATCK